MKQLDIKAEELDKMTGLRLLELLYELEIVDVVYLNDIIEIKERKEEYYV
jgi:hypothetical protein